MALYQISAIRELYAFENGDTITPGMGVSIDSGYALAQYFDPATGTVVNTDFTMHPATLYPQAFSSSAMTIVVPERIGQQWYYNNMNEASAILDENGNVKEKFASLFEVGSIAVNGVTFPSLKIKGNLATSSDHTSKTIYYSSTYNGKSFTCSQQIPIQKAVGNSYAILLSYKGEGGIEGDTVISSENDFVEVTAYLQQSGVTVGSGVSYSFEVLENGNWVDARQRPGISVTANVAKIGEIAVDGVETFRAVAAYNGERYYQPFQLSDIQDVYFMDDGCSVAGDAVSPGTDVRFTPTVLLRSTGEIDHNFWTFTFQVLRRSDNSVIREIAGTSLTVDYATIRNNKGVRVRIHAIKDDDDIDMPGGDGIEGEPAE